MKSFNQYLKEDATEGAVFEEVIVAAWNGSQPPKTKNIPPDAGLKIVQYLKKNGIEGDSASKLATKGVEVTPKWASFWAPEKVPSSTKTPKTDILIGNNRISLKMGAAQLMSGGVNESRATFYSAVESIGGVEQELFKPIWEKMNTLTRGATSKGKVEGELKKGKDDFLKMANDVNNEVKVLMKNAFTNNEEFRLEFIREAMSGEKKFGTKSKAYAEYILSSDAAGNKPHLYSVSDEDFLNKVARKTDVTVRFKSTSVKSKNVKTGEYRYWTVVALGVKKLEEEIDSHQGMYLTEGIISGIFQRVKSFMISMFAKVYEWLRSSVKNIITYFDLQPEIVFNNQIDFTRI